MERMQSEILRHHIRPSAAIAAALSPQLARLEAVRPVVGVHVRASNEHFRARQAPPVAAYVRAVRTAMRKVHANGVFLATDNSAVQDIFVREFGAGCVFWTDKWLPEPGGAIHLDGTCPDRRQAAYDALIDMLLLAAADFLVTFQSSSFSIAARLFSETPESRRMTLIVNTPLWQRSLGKLMRTCACTRNPGGH
jgi:hypothetical protein